MPERWRHIPHWPYQVSDHGRVRRVRSEKCLKPATNHNGYHKVALFDRGRRKYPFVHRLVATAFLGECPPGHETNHKDGVRTNNHISNLEWVTPRENTRHGMTHGGIKLVGSEQPSARLHERDIPVIRHMLTLPGWGPSRIGRVFEVHNSTIANIKAGRGWNHVPHAAAKEGKTDG